MSKTTRNERLSAKKVARGIKPSKPVQQGIRSAKTKVQTKQSMAIGMLRSKIGTTIPALMKVTGWQQHSVRGFLAGVVRKRLKLPLASRKINGCRTYRIGGIPSGTTIGQAGH